MRRAAAACAALILSLPAVLAQTSTPASPAKAAKAAKADKTAVKRRHPTTRYDVYFKKYTKRYFGPGFDWRLFKAQSMAESDLIPTAKSHVGARGLMQLMPATYAQIKSTRPQYESIDEPEWNIAAGILHDKGLWITWTKKVPDDERPHFMMASYNAGDGTIRRAQSAAKKSQLDPQDWESLVVVAPKVTRWRYRETIGYVSEIDENYAYLQAPRESAANIAPR